MFGSCVMRNPESSGGWRSRVTAYSGHMGEQFRTERIINRLEAARLIVEVAQIVVHEGDEKNGLVHLPHPHLLSCEDLAQIHLLFSSATTRPTRYATRCDRNRCLDADRPRNIRCSHFLRERCLESHEHQSRHLLTVLTADRAIREIAPADLRVGLAERSAWLALCQPAWSGSSRLGTACSSDQHPPRVCVQRTAARAASSDLETPSNGSIRLDSPLNRRIGARSARSRPVRPAVDDPAQGW